MELFSLNYWKELAVHYGIFGLAVNAFIEAIFFPVPPDVLLIALCVANPQDAFLYAFVATIFSSLGGVGGYGVGYYGGRPIAERLFGRERVEKVHRLYDDYESLVILLAGFTPLPYKVFTVTSGVLFASLKKLFVFSIIGRGARFFLEGAMFYFFGYRIEEFVVKYMGYIFSACGVLLVGGYFLLRKFKR